MKESRYAGNFGGSWIVPNATTTPEGNNYWRKLVVLNDMTVSAIVGVNLDGTHSTQVWKAGAEICGHFTSITCTNASAAGLIYGEYGNRTV